jgi:5-dehydro-2-deoxygluconokinase
VPAPEILTMGRVGVDLYPEQIGVPLAEVTTFRKGLGGSATNVAVAAARLGRRAAVITKVGADPFGPFVRRALEDFGVDVRWVSTDPNELTPIVFCEIFPPDRFPILFYRRPKAPDMNISVDDLDLEAIESAALFWTTGTGLSDEPSRTATLAATEARPSGSITVHDLDYRPALWAAPDDARAQAARILKKSTVALGNIDEVEMATGIRDPFDGAAALLDLGADIAIVKRGAEGVLGRTHDHLVEIPAVRVKIVCGLGAGDAFGGALSHALLSGWDLQRSLRFANAAGAIVASRLLCADAMPTLEEIDELLGDSAGGELFTG